MSCTSFIVITFLVLFAATSVHSYIITPHPIPRAAQQCVNAGYSGACMDPYMELNMLGRCRFLKCAKKFGNHYQRVIMEDPPMEGTDCGFSKICVNRSCNEVEQIWIPNYDGTDSQYPCIAR